MTMMPLASGTSGLPPNAEAGVVRLFKLSISAPAENVSVKSESFAVGKRLRRVPAAVPATETTASSLDWYCTVPSLRLTVMVTLSMFISPRFDLDVKQDRFRPRLLRPAAAPPPSQFAHPRAD